MPELPEVETVRAGLEQSLLGEVIARVTLHRNDLRFPFPNGFKKNLEGRKVTNVRRRAKYLLLGLDSGDDWLIHLGMSGRILVHDAMPDVCAKHDHVVVKFKGEKTLIFNDARRFGMMDIIPKGEMKAHLLLAHLGPEPLEKTFNPTYLKSALVRRKAPIKTSLMDQELVVGVGNIYASEALFLSGIHPQLPAYEAADKAALLVRSIQNVLKAAIASGGSTLRDYVRSTGDMGYFQHQFAVYGREGAPCNHCATLIERIVQAGRSTFFCPTCQPRKC